MLPPPSEQHLTDSPRPIPQPGHSDRIGSRGQWQQPVRTPAEASRHPLVGDWRGSHRHVNNRLRLYPSRPIRLASHSVNSTHRYNHEPNRLPKVKFETTEIRSALSDLRPQPAPVSDWDVEIGTDSGDEPAVWVWAVLDDKDVDLDTRISIRDCVVDFISEECEIPVWVFVSFKSASETAGSA